MVLIIKQKFVHISNTQISPFSVAWSLLALLSIHWKYKQIPVYIAWLNSVIYITYICQYIILLNSAMVGFTDLHLLNKLYST